MRLNTLLDALESELADLYSGEQQLIQSLPKFISAATSPTLKEAV